MSGSGSTARRTGRRGASRRVRTPRRLLQETCASRSSSSGGSSAPPRWRGTTWSTDGARLVRGGASKSIGAPHSSQQSSARAQLRQKTRDGAGVHLRCRRGEVVDSCRALVRLGRLLIP
jgi:hypothetical protein